MFHLQLKHGEVIALPFKNSSVVGLNFPPITLLNAFFTACHALSFLTIEYRSFPQWRIPVLYCITVNTIKTGLVIC